ncbi:hypothetical protein M885DRAFT_58885 [Pelagophyceae sp. CCMP2097]|nr:hypothetical protein M885DRAFT_58885 [Pelagophyceae sp. CCMP2097]
MPVFTEFVRKHPAMLAPAFLMQQALRSKILGEKWWDRRAAERVHIGGKAVNIRALLAAHLSEETFHAFMMSVEEDQPMPDGHALTEAWDAEDAKKAVHSTGLVAQRRRSSGLSGPQGDVIDKYTDPARTSPQPARTSPQKTAARIYRLKSKIHLITVTAPAPSPPHSPATLPVTLPRPGHVRGESWRAAPPITTPPRTRAPSPMTTPPRHVPGESWRITSSITTPERRRPRITPHLSSMSAS